MPGKRKPYPSPAAAAAPLVLHPRSLYTIHTATEVLGLPRNTLRTEIREGRLRFAMRAGRILILGRWLLQWVEEGERRRRPKPTPAESLPLRQLRRVWEKAGPEDRAAFLAEVGKE